MLASPMPVGRFPTAIICLEAFSEAETFTIWLQGIILLAALHDWAEMMATYSRFHPPELG